MPPKRLATELADRPVDLSTRDLVKVLASFVASGSNSTVTCGGSIALADVAARIPRARGVRASRPSQAGRKSPTAEWYTATGPIALWWDRPLGFATKVTFPVTDATNTVGIEDFINAALNTGAFKDFMSDCGPAGLGRPGQDVYDESVRKALAMDASLFATNLCPYALGIVDRIKQLLLPNVAGIGRGGVKNGGFIRAELYEMNVSKNDAQPSDS